MRVILRPEPLIGYIFKFKTTFFLKSTAKKQKGAPKRPKNQKNHALE
jgi:hypothetical protein